MRFLHEKIPHFYMKIFAFFLLSMERYLSGNPWDGIKLGCKLIQREMYVEENSCKSDTPLVFTYCKGTCRSASLSSYKYPYYTTRCECCQAVAATVKKVRLYCPHQMGKNITAEEE